MSQEATQCIFNLIPPIHEFQANSEHSLAQSWIAMNRLQHSCSDATRSKAGDPWH